MNPVKSVVRMPFLVLIFVVRVLWMIVLFPSMAMQAIFLWAMKDEATVLECADYFWASMKFGWYPLFSEGCDDAYDVMKVYDRKWGNW